MTTEARTADQICRLVGGELLGVSPAGRLFSAVAPLDRAGESDVSFLTGPRYRSHMAQSGAGLVLVPQALRDCEGPELRVVVDDPHRAIAQVLDDLYGTQPDGWGIDPSSRIGAGTAWSGRIRVGQHAVIGQGVRFGANCVVGDHAVVMDGARVGHATVIGPSAFLGPGTVLGNEVVVQSGARIGTDGFGFVPGQHTHVPVRHVGTCRVGDRVHIGANACLARGSVSDTTVGDETKVDNLVQVGHNCRIGKRCFIMAQVGMAGSTIVEDDVILAGQAGLAGHLTVGTGARVAAQGGVIGDVAPHQTVSDYPARDHRQALRQSAALRRLTPLARRLEALAESHDRG